MTTTPTRPSPRSYARRACRLLAAPVLCVVTLGAPPQAMAETFTDADATGDVVQYADGGPWQPAPDRSLNDVTATTLTHSPTRIRLQVQYADLRRRTYHAVLLQVVTDEGARRAVFLEADPERAGTRARMSNGRGNRVRCSIHHAVDYAAGTATIGFSRRCAADPGWVRARVGVMSADDQLYLDDALRDRPLAESDRGYVLSPRVHRGEVE